MVVAVAPAAVVRPVTALNPVATAVMAGPAVTAMASRVWMATVATAVMAAVTVVPVGESAVLAVPEAVVLPVVGRTAPTEPMAPWLFE
jgi:hypothetical protein